ncbi:hypothetical protein [Clostridium sp.]|uniref:hypothetical protein n=1 Tax=Clostridium sp. TaxID=1506 RepID=UPI002625C8E0|nr:hypothetical protein [Clostridium sp.]
MFKFDHFVINIDSNYQNNKNTIRKIIDTGFPYKPSWGKGTSGFKASNLWIGNEYFEMINILKPNGGGYKSEWVNLYNKGHRGLVCIMLDVADINEVYDTLTQKEVDITKPEFLKFKWFFNLFTRTMPWQNCYINFFEGISLQIGFQQMKDEKTRKFMEGYMVPNSKDNDITGISKIVIKGPLTSADEKLIETIFDEYIIHKEPLTIKLNSEQLIVFQNSENFNAGIFTICNNLDLCDKNVSIENVTIYNKFLSLVES